MRAAILSAALAGLLSSGGTYAVVQYRQPDMQPEIQQARTDGDLNARLELAKREDNAALLNKILEVDSAILSGQRAMLDVLKSGAASELAQSVALDEHVLQIACLIKGCKPQAMR